MPLTAFPHLAEEITCATELAVVVHGEGSVGICASPGGCFGAIKCHGVVAGRDFALSIVKLS